MFGAIRRMLRRRQLRPVLAVVPWELQKLFGATRHYTYGQVRRCHEKLKLKPELLTFAAAVYCKEEEFIRSAGGLAAEIYRELRSELCQLFNLDPRDLNAEGVRKVGMKPRWNPSPFEHSPPPDNPH